jgi:multiple sugar transport system substrate-binding protein
MSTTKNIAAAAALAEFVNTNPTAAFALTQAPTFDFPVMKSVLGSDGFLATAPAFYGSQKVYQAYSAYNNTVGKNYEWSPFQDQVYTLWTNDVLDAILKKGDTAAAVDKWQADTVKYAKDQGYTVTTK